MWTVCFKVIISSKLIVDYWVGLASAEFPSWLKQLGVNHACDHDVCVYIYFLKGPIVNKLLTSYVTGRIVKYFSFF